MQADYKMITLLLSGNHLSHSPAELHGLLTGQLCSGVAEPDPEALGDLLDQGGHLAPVVRKLVEHLREETAAQLSHLDYHFQPLLPPDEAGLQERVFALGAWCDAFTVGFATGYIKPETALTPEAREILSDFGQFATVADDADDAEELDEKDEVDYMELVEYVRMATITLYQQFGAVSPGAVPFATGFHHPDPDSNGFVH